MLHNSHFHVNTCIVRAEGLHFSAFHETMTDLRKESNSSSVPNSRFSSASQSAEESSDAPRSVQRRRSYTPMETGNIMDYFAWHIDQGISVPLNECKEFLRSHPMTRTPKNIQDKVKSFIKAKLSK